MTYSLDNHITHLCLLSEALVSATTDDAMHNLPGRIDYHMRALQAAPHLLTIGEILNHVNRAPAPDEEFAKEFAKNL